MQAIQLENYGIANLTIADIPIPIIGDHEVLVKTSAVSLQYLDLVAVENMAALNIPLPFVPVSEGMGIVEEVGKSVTRWKKGDRVLIPFIRRWEAGRNTEYHNALRTGLQTPGLLSEFTSQPENTLVEAPYNLTDQEASSLSIAALTAWTFLMKEADIKAGQSILIQGTGGVSLAALQIAKMAGLKIIATTGSREKESKLLALGVDQVINYKEFPDWSHEVMRLNRGVGVDVTLDVAGQSTIEQSIHSVKEHGFVGLVGFMSGDRLSFDAIPLIMRYIRLQGYSVGNTQDLQDLVRAVEINNLIPIIDSVYRLEDVQDAFERLQSGEAFGKVIIQF